MDEIWRTAWRELIGLSTGSLAILIAIVVYFYKRTEKMKAATAKVDSDGEDRLKEAKEGLNEDIKTVAKAHETCSKKTATALAVVNNELGHLKEGQKTIISKLDKLNGVDKK